jgi:CheY-like chemotaxis protein
VRRITVNEPIVRLTTTLKDIDGQRYRTATVTDRLAFRQIYKGSQPLPGQPLPSCTHHLLLVEDSDDDALLFMRAVQRSGQGIKVHRATNVNQAREMLAEFAPALIALDCHLLRGESGLDILRELRGRKAFQTVPIVMLSGTESDLDVQAAYALGANSFVRKPNGYGEYMESVQLMLEYWLVKNCVSVSHLQFSPMAPPRGLQMNSSSNARNALRKKPGTVPIT